MPQDCCVANEAGGSSAYIYVLAYSRIAQRSRWPKENRTHVARFVD